MAKIPMTKNLKRIHRRFIPGNLIFCIIALIALWAQLTMPFFDLRIRITGAKLVPVIEQTLEREDDALSYASTEDSSESKEKDLLLSAAGEALADVNLEIPINLYPMKMLKAATGSEEDIASFMNSVVGKNGTTEFLADTFNSLAKTVVKTTIRLVIDEAIDQTNLTEEQLAQIELYKDDAAEIVEKLTEGTPESVAAAKNQFVDTMGNVAQTKGETLSEKEVEELESYFDALVSQGTAEDGSFDIMHLLKNFDVNALEGNGSTDDSASPQAFVTASAHVATPVAEESGVESTQSELGKIVEILENPGKLMLDALKDSGMDVKTIQTALLVVFLLMAGIQAFFWALFAFSCLVRIFTQRKCVRTRYVRIFCVWCGLGVLVGNLAVSAIPKVLGKAGLAASTLSTVELVLEAFSLKFKGAGVVTGICWIIMVVFNLFFYRPIRRKLKKETKRLKKLMKEGVDVTQEEDEEKTLYDFSAYQAPTEEEQAPQS